MSSQEALVYRAETVHPPGDTLLELIEERGMSQSDLAKRTGLSAKHINQIIKGIAAISAETALLFERALGTPAVIWTNLESAFQVQLSRQSEDERFSKDLDWLQHLPVKELIQRGHIQSRERPVELLREVCNFFGVANRGAWETLWQKPTAYRRSKAFVSDPFAVAAWLRIGELRALDIDCRPFDRQRLVERLQTLRGLTREVNPQIWAQELIQICADVGVAVVLEPEIAGARVLGAARWVSPDKALVQLSLRHRWSDIFWFTLFHELGHLLMHSKKDVFINDPGPHSGPEQEADGFASQLLIPRQYENRLADLENDSDVIAFADELRIGADIVVGRLQFEKRWAYNRGTSLKHRFTFK